MNILALLFALLMLREGVLTMQSTLMAAKAIADARIQVMASGSPCPVIRVQERCFLKIESRNLGQWEVCNQLEPPSGADLPIERWFRLYGHCQIETSLTGQIIEIPYFLVFR
jgi:hypothetical protein